MDLISPITQWAGLKGDVLKHRREQLRIHQEAALDRLAEAVQRKMKGEEIVRPLPPKIMVPALEAASLEDPESPLIEWWANLLASGAKGVMIRPYFVDLMKVIGSEEAAYLDQIWQRFSVNDKYLTSNVDVGLNTLHNLKTWLEEKLTELKGRQLKRDTYLQQIMSVLEYLGERTEANGIEVELSIALGKRSKSLPTHTISVVWRSKLYEKPIPLEICRALNLLTDDVASLELDFQRHKIGIPIGFERVLRVESLYPSNLGMEFLLACHPRARHAARQDRGDAGAKA